MRILFRRRTYGTTRHHADQLELACPCPTHGAMLLVCNTFMGATAHLMLNAITLINTSRSVLILHPKVLNRAMMALWARDTLIACSTGYRTFVLQKISYTMATKLIRQCLALDLSCMSTLHIICAVHSQIGRDAYMKCLNQHCCCLDTAILLMPLATPPVSESMRRLNTVCG